MPSMNRNPHGNCKHPGCILINGHLGAHRLRNGESQPKKKPAPGHLLQIADL